MCATPAIKLITAEEYLVLEDASAVKHKLICGQLYAMAGASFAHNQIVSNTFGDIF